MSWKQSSQAKSLNIKNVSRSLSSPPPFFNLQLHPVFCFSLYHGITSLRDNNALAHSDISRSCGISTKCHNVSKVMRAGRTDKQWRYPELPFPGTLNFLSTRRMNSSYCRSFHISLLIIGAVLYRGVVGRRMFTGDVSRFHKFTVVLQCRTCWNSGFLGHTHKRQSQPCLKLDRSLEPLIHKELGNTGNMCLSVLKVHWKRLCITLWFPLGFLLKHCFSYKALLYVCRGFRPKYCTEHHNFILQQ